MTPYCSFYHFPYSLQAPVILSLKCSNGHVVKSNVNCSQLVFIFEVCWFYFKAKESLKAHCLSLITLVIFMVDYLCLQILPNQYEWPRTLLFRSLAIVHRTLAQVTAAEDAEMSAQHCNNSDQKTSKQAPKMDQLVITHRKSTFNILVRQVPFFRFVISLACPSSINQMVFLVQLTAPLLRLSDF